MILYRLHIYFKGGSWEPQGRVVTSPSIAIWICTAPYSHGVAPALSSDKEGMGGGQYVRYNPGTVRYNPGTVRYAGGGWDGGGGEGKKKIRIRKKE